MKLKISEYTPFFVIALIVVLIVQHFYDPLQLFDLWEIYSSENKNIGIPIAIVQAIFSVCCPVLMALVEFMAYMGNFMMSLNDDRFSLLFISAIMCLGYVCVSYFLEKFHVHWHEEEGTFAMCVDMLCVENIVMYVFNLSFYFITERIVKVDLPDQAWVALFMIIALPALWSILFYMLYIVVGVLVTMAIPCLIAVLLGNVVSEGIAEIVLIILFIFFSQIVWRLCSAAIYNGLLKKFSFNHWSID